MIKMLSERSVPQKLFFLLLIYSFKAALIKISKSLIKLQQGDDTYLKLATGKDASGMVWMQIVSSDYGIPIKLAELVLQD